MRSAEVSGHTRSDRHQSTAGMSHTLMPIFHTVSMASLPPTVMAYVHPPSCTATNIQYGVVTLSDNCSLSPPTAAVPLHWYNKALTVSGNWQLSVMTPYNTTTYWCLHLCVVVQQHLHCCVSVSFALFCYNSMLLLYAWSQLQDLSSVCLLLLYSFKVCVKLNSVILKASMLRNRSDNVKK
jgi:hypothetical protein